jgi:flagellar biosynthesis/type III secretory pathway protein FliH
MGSRIDLSAFLDEAIEALEHVTRIDSTYQDAPALLNRARRELEQAAAERDQQTKHQAEEQAQENAQDRAWQETQEQAELDDNQRVVRQVKGMFLFIVGLLAVLVTLAALSEL